MSNLMVALAPFKKIPHNQPQRLERDERVENNSVQLRPV